MTRKHNYVVGFNGEGQCAYGKDTPHESIDLMSIFQAKRAVKKLFKSTRAHPKRTIFKLVPVETID